MNRSTLRSRVADALGSRLLIWSGIRGSDAESLTDLPQFDACFTILDAYERRPLTTSVAYEGMAARRPDMERWDIDDHLGEAAAQEFRRGLLRTMAAPCALIPYRPSRFLSALWFARQDRCLKLGLFGAHQNAFEHKPWVETSLRTEGLPGLGWTYVADEEQLQARDFLKDGPVVLRRSRTSGGEGITRVHTPGQMTTQWPEGDEAFVSVSPFVSGGLPLNVGATVWGGPTGEAVVTVHHASLQLIGIPSCGNRPFGYCGNDFGAAAGLPDETLAQVERSTRTIGAWLGRHGYRGTFGVDFLVKDGVPLFTEINARFQGSSALSSRLSVEADLPCLMLEHAAAFLGLAPVGRPPLVEQVRSVPPAAQIVVHWRGEAAAEVDAQALDRALRRIDPACQAEALVPRGVKVEPGGIVGRFVTRSRVTEGGFDLATPWADTIDEWQNGALVAAGKDA